MVVLGGGDDHGEVHRRLDVVDLLRVLLHLLQDLPRLQAHSKTLHHNRTTP